MRNIFSYSKAFNLANEYDRRGDLGYTVDYIDDYHYVSKTICAYLLQKN